jgi:hypothetical protein
MTNFRKDHIQANGVDFHYKKTSLKEERYGKGSISNASKRNQSGRAL